MKRKLEIITLILAILLVSNASATLESAVFGFGKSMSLNYISSQNPVLGKTISFALCAQCAITSEALGVIGEIDPELAKGLQVGLNPGAAVKQELLGQVYQQLDPQEQQILANIQKFEPYIKEAFRENPQATEGQEKATIEIDEDKNTIIKDSEGNVFAKIPEGFDVIESEEAFILVNKEAKEDAVLEIKDYKIRVGKDAKVSFSEREGITSINLEGSGDIDAAGTQLNNIKDATIRLDEDKQVEYAEFTSLKRETYEFTYDNENFVFTTNLDSYVKFDPKTKQLSGENVDLNYKNQQINALKIDATWDENNLKEVRLSANGIYKDLENNLEYSSEEDFNVYLDGRDVLQEKNAISVLKDGPRVQLDAKGKIKVTNGITYQGLSEDVYTRYRTWENVFDVKYGDASIDNGMHQVYFKDGRTYLSTENLAKEGEVESFTFRYTKDEKAEDVSYTLVNEESGNLELLSLKDGKETKTVLYSLNDYGNKLESAIQDDLTAVKAEDLRLEVEQDLREIDEQIEVKLAAGEDVSELEKQKSALEFAAVGLDAQESIVGNDVDGAIGKLEAFVKDHKGEDVSIVAQSAVASLYETKANSIADSIREFDKFEYKSGQYVAEQIGDGFVHLGEISKVDENGVYIDYTKGAYSAKGVEYVTFDKLRSYSISKYVDGEHDITRIQYNPVKKEFMYAQHSEIATPDLKESDLSKSLLLTEQDKIISGVEENYQKAIMSLREISLTADEQTKEEVQDIIAGMERKSQLIKANTYLLAQNYDQAIYEARDMIKYKDIESEARYLQGMALLGNGEPRVALAAFDYAAKANLESESAKEADLRRKELELAFLDTISSAISSENAQIGKMWEEKIGLNNRVWNVGVGKSVMTLFGYYDDLETITTYERTKLSNQEKGLMLVKHLYKRGYELEDIQKLKREDVAREYKLPIDSTDGKTKRNAAATSVDMYNSIQDAFQNPDVKNLVSGARTPFNFETGEGYVDKSFVETDWQDAVLNGVNVKNVAIFVAPMAKVGKGVAWTTGIAKGGLGAKIPVLGQLGSEAYYAKLAASPTTISVIGGGIRTGLEATPGIKTVLKTGDSLKGITANSRIMQAMSSKAPTLSKVGTWVGANAVENIAGIGAGKIAGLVHPALELPIRVLVDYGSSYANIFDMTENVVKSAARSGLKLAEPSISKVLLTGANEPISALKFSNAKQLGGFIDNTKGVKRISNNLYDYKGNKFVTFIDDVELDNLEGIKYSLEPKELVSLQDRNIANLQKKNPLKVFERPEPIELTLSNGNTLEIEPASYSQEIRMLTKSNKIGGEVGGEVSYTISGNKIIEKTIETPKVGQIIKVNMPDGYMNRQFLVDLADLKPEALSKIDLKTTFDIDKTFDELTSQEKFMVRDKVYNLFPGKSRISKLREQKLLIASTYSSVYIGESKFNAHTHPLTIPQEISVENNIVEAMKEKPFGTDFWTESGKEIRRESIPKLEGEIKELRKNVDIINSLRVEKNIDVKETIGELERKKLLEGINFDPKTGDRLIGSNDIDKMKRRLGLFLEQTEKKGLQNSIELDIKDKQEVLEILKEGTDEELYFRTIKYSGTSMPSGKDIGSLRGREWVTLGDGTKIQIEKIVYPHGRVYAIIEENGKLHMLRSKSGGGYESLPEYWKEYLESK